MRSWLVAAGFALGSACALDEEQPFEQPGADDPSARAWTKAGVWYPEDPDELDADVETLLDAVGGDSPRRAVAILTPHAGLSTSGPTAAEAYARTVIEPRVLVLAPDHWGDGAHTAIWPDGPWLIPGHAIEVDAELTASLRDALPELEDDRVPFDNHEEEMQLPFLQWLRPEVKVAWVTIFDNSRNHFADFDLERIDAWGVALAGVLQAEADAGRPVLLVTTTDLTHRQTLETQEVEDDRLLGHIAALDIEGLHGYVTTEEISMCGEIPTAIMMAALRTLGRDSMEIVARGSDFHHSNDPESVIGYPAAAAWQ